MQPAGSSVQWAPAYRSSVINVLRAEVPFMPKPGQFEHMCSVKSKSPEGCILMTMLAMLEYTRDPVAGTSMLVHCLDHGFVASRQPGRPPALRLADQAFLEEHLLGRPELIKTFLTYTAGSDKIGIEVHQSCLCGRESSYLANKNQVVESSVRTTENRLRKLRLAVVGASISDIVSEAKSLRSGCQHLLISDCGWTEDYPRLVSVRRLNGGWKMYNWFSIFPRPDH